MIPKIEAKWPGPRWSTVTLENKLRALKDYWRVFREIIETSGNDYDRDTGQVIMSEDNKAKFLERNPTITRRILKDSLLISESITHEEYYIIFSKDLPAGRFITEADDDAAFEAHHSLTQPPSEEANTQISTQVVEVDEDDPDLFADDHLSHEEAEESHIIPIDSSASVVIGRKRLNTTEIPLNNGIGFPNKRQKGRAQGITVDDAKEIVSSAVASQATRHHTFSHRPVGSEDLELAISDCRKSLQYRGIVIVLQAVKWISEDPVRVITWNCLGNQEEKDMWFNNVINI